MPEASALPLGSVGNPASNLTRPLASASPRGCALHPHRGGRAHRKHHPVNTRNTTWRAFAAALGGLLAEAYLSGDGSLAESHPPDMYRSHLAQSATWIR
ncbi:hypothetical protein SAMN04489834_3462 [Microterricola viridarii]|uniref:Uncharacterized protein n=1 Tax=Microterricola viridarii TaxID=412690 RepID=A0A1H1ZHC3_9MICO|nr:hypothetical protein SAMN04489834_3462 [Microterricola viridarii]